MTGLARVSLKVLWYQIISDRLIGFPKTSKDRVCDHWFSEISLRSFVMASRAASSARRQKTATVACQVPPLPPASAAWARYDRDHVISTVGLLPITRFSVDGMLAFIAADTLNYLTPRRQSGARVTQQPTPKKPCGNHGDTRRVSVLPEAVAAP